MCAGVVALAGCTGNPATADAAPRIEVTYYPTQTALPLPTVSAPPTPEPTPSPTPTPLPTPVPTAQPELAAMPATHLFTPAGPSAYLTGIRHERQTWNNCGPATISMLLSRFGRAETQREAALFLKPDKDDKNVSPDELVAYAQSLGYEAQAVVGGDVDMLRTLVTNGIPVIVETWFIPEPDDEMGHYQLLMGYDSDSFIFYDSYEGPDLKEKIEKFEPLWKVFNDMAVVVWRPEQRPFVMDILGELSDPSTMHERALAKAQAGIAANPQDKFAWFNAGSNLHALGRHAEAGSSLRHSLCAETALAHDVVSVCALCCLLCRRPARAGDRPGQCHPQAREESGREHLLAWEVAGRNGQCESGARRLSAGACVQPEFHSGTSGAERTCGDALRRVMPHPSAIAASSATTPKTMGDDSAGSTPL